MNYTELTVVYYWNMIWLGFFFAFLWHMIFGIILKKLL